MRFENESSGTGKVADVRKMTLSHESVVKCYSFFIFVSFCYKFLYQMVRQLPERQAL